MKLRDVAKGTRAIHRITMRLANVAEAAQPGQPASGESAQVVLGVRVLTGAETAEVYEKAQARAREKSVPEWSEEHPICALYRMVFTLLVACVDVDDSLPFFDSADQILEDTRVGTENIAFLFERWVAWQDQCSPRFEKLTAEQVVGMVFADLEAPDSPDSPLLRSGHATLVSCVRTLGRLLSTSLTDRSPSGLPGEPSAWSSKSAGEKLPVGDA